jgi:hypothetical protein
MPKRFTDTDKWRKPFIRTLSTPYKLLWFYILDECDHAGIWHVEFDVAQLRIGEEITKEEAIKQFKEHLIIVDCGSKWFIPDFIQFQYGTLNVENRAHSSVIDRLNRYGLLHRMRDYISPLQGAKEKEQDKDMDKDILKNKEAAFKNEVLTFKKYHSSTLNDFILYWTEPNKSKTRLRYELEKTWDTSRRLATWAANESKFGKGHNKEQPVRTSKNWNRIINDDWDKKQPQSLADIIIKKTTQ